MYGLSVYIDPEDILEKLSDEDKARFNQCVFTDVHRDMYGGVTIDCVVFYDPDAHEYKGFDKCRQKYCDDGAFIIE